MHWKEDNTYNEMRKNSATAWLNELVQSDDIVSRDSAKVVLEYIEHLNKEIKILEDRNALKDDFLKRLKSKINK